MFYNIYIVVIYFVAPQSLIGGVKAFLKTFC